VILVLVAVAAACSTVPSGGVDERFPRAEITVGGEPWDVAVADTVELRRRGLQGVDDLAELDGMLFVFSTDTEASFTMRGTLMAIDVAFFSGDGTVVDVVEMVPCEAEPCPSYRASGAYRYALETEAGGLRGDLELVLDPASLP
jgi:uncharacterized membrane protein (UPF0127 family)